MKPLKRAEQKNATVDAFFYTEEQYKALAQIEGIGTVEKYDAEATELRVFLLNENVKSIEVACIDGSYCTVCRMNSGEVIHIEL